MKVALAAVFLAAALIAGAGCGGGGSGGADVDKTFEGDGYSFTYPEDWDEQDPEARNPGAETTSSAIVGQDNTNVMAVLVYPLPVSVTKDNIDDEADEISAGTKEIFEELDGRLAAGPTPVTIGGLPGFRFEGSLVNVDNVRVQVQLTRVFDGRTEYYLYCQFSPERAEEMKPGCEQVVESLRVE